MHNLSTARRFNTALLAGALLWPGLAQAAGSLTIVVNPGPFSSIEEAATSHKQVNFWDDNPVDDAGCTESFAATELLQFLPKCTALKAEEILLAKADTLPAKGDVILIGSRTSNPLIASINKDLDSNALTSPESFRIRSVGNGGRTLVVIEGKSRVGSLYGTYAFLETLGVRFFGLGEKGTVYPAETAELPKELNIIENPKFVTRGFYAGYARGNKTFWQWMARNRMNLWTADETRVHLLKKLGIKLAAGGHHVQSDFLAPNLEYPYNHPKFDGDNGKPQDPYTVSKGYRGDRNKDGKLCYAEVHPEWYAKIGGHRTGSPKDKDVRFNYCTSNHDAPKELARNMIKSLIDGDFRYADIVDVWMLDGRGSWCQCEACKEQGRGSDRHLAMVHGIFQEIEKARKEGRLKRKIQLFGLAYLTNLEPPTKPLPEDFDYENCSITFFPISRCYAHPLADPTCTEINHHTLKCYEGWAFTSDSQYKGFMAIGEYYNVSSLKTLPNLYTKIMAADIPYYYRTGARHLNYMHTPTDLWGTWTLNQRLLAQLLWNPDADVNGILDDYFKNYYPTTTERTRRFYEKLERATANCKAYKHHVWLGGERYSCLPGMLNNMVEDILPLEHLPYGVNTSRMNNAPGMVEIVAAFRQARREIDDALLECTDKTEQLRLIEDERRFDYGEAMFLYLYHMVRTDIFHHRDEEDLARNEFKHVERMAERLRNVVDLVNVSHRHASAPNGLEATQTAPGGGYDKLKALYGDEEKKAVKQKKSKSTDPFISPDDKK